jgi:hypothetical protein
VVGPPLHERYNSPVTHTPDALDRPDDDEVPSGPGASRAALVSGAIGVVALAAAAVVYLVGGRPYGVNVGGGVLYLLGLLAALVASVLLWMVWAEPDRRSSPRRGLGIATASAALVLTCVCVVVSLAHVSGGGVQIGLMIATAVVLAAGVGVAMPSRAGSAGHGTVGTAS